MGQDDPKASKSGSYVMMQMNNLKTTGINADKRSIFEESKNKTIIGMVKEMTYDYDI